VECPTVDDTTVVCFESHLIAGLGLPPSKFLVAVTGFLGSELVHLNPNTIDALIYFTMLCECWLGIAPNTSLFLYFYSLARYNKVVYSGIGMSLHRHRHQQYINATPKSSWRGSSSRWFLVDMHVPPQWSNMHLLPSLIDTKRKELKLTPRLTVLVKWLTELYDTGFWACHCVEEFTLRQIHPLDHWDKLTYECLQQANPSHEPADGKFFNFAFCC
jgi:hypothetical protein